MTTDFRDFSKSLSKHISALTIICNEIFITLDERIMSLTTRSSHDMLNRLLDILKSYSVFASALNLMISYSVSWNYNRKKLILLTPNEKTTGKISQLFIDYIAQAKILKNALAELSKKLDRNEGPSEKSAGITNFRTAAAFLLDEINGLESVQNDLKLKLDALLKLKPEKSARSKTGSGEQSISLRRAMQQRIKELKLSIAGGDDDPIGYKIKIGGYSAQKQTFLGGVEASYQLKERILKLENLRKDISSDHDFYNDIFLVKVGEIIAPLMQKQREPIDALLEIACTNPNILFAQLCATYITYVKDIHRSIDDANSILEKYIANRNPNFKAQPMEKIALVYLSDLITQIDVSDRILANKYIDDEFKKLNEITTQKNLDEYIVQLKIDINRISAEDFEPLTRHIDKQKIREIMNAILRENFPAPEQIDLSAIKYVPPCITREDLEKLPIDAREKKIIEIIDYIISIESALLPKIDEIELQYANFNNNINDVIKEITQMIDPANKLTCVKRPILLICTIMRCEILRAVAKRRNFTFDQHICSEILASIHAKYNLKYTKLYCKNGLCEIALNELFTLLL